MGRPSFDVFKILTLLNVGVNKRDKFFMILICMHAPYQSFTVSGEEYSPTSCLLSLVALTAYLT